MGPKGDPCGKEGWGSELPIRSTNRAGVCGLARGGSEPKSAERQHVLRPAASNGERRTEAKVTPGIHVNSGTRHRLEEPFSQPSECHSFLGSPEIWPGALCAEGVNPELQSPGVWLSPRSPSFLGGRTGRGRCLSDSVTQFSLCLKSFKLGHQRVFMLRGITALHVNSGCCV